MAHKVTPAIFEVWMRLLQKINGSVLWLLRDNATAEANLRKEAAAMGLEVSPVAGADVQTLVNNIYNAPPELLRKIRVALGYQ